MAPEVLNPPHLFHASPAVPCRAHVRGHPGGLTSCMRCVRAPRYASSRRPVARHALGTVDHRAVVVAVPKVEGIGRERSATAPAPHDLAVQDALEPACALASVGRPVTTLLSRPSCPLTLTSVLGAAWLILQSRAPGLSADLHASPHSHAPGSAPPTSARARHSATGQASPASPRAVVHRLASVTSRHAIRASAVAVDAEDDARLQRPHLLATRAGLGHRTSPSLTAAVPGSTVNGGLVAGCSYRWPHQQGSTRDMRKAPA